MESCIYFAATGGRFSPWCAYHWFLAAIAIYASLRAGGTTNTKALLITGGILSVPVAWFFGPYVWNGAQTVFDEPAPIIQNIETEDTEGVFPPIEQRKEAPFHTYYVLSQEGKHIEIEAIQSQTLESHTMPLPEEAASRVIENASNAACPRDNFYLALQDDTRTIHLYALDLMSLNYTVLRKIEQPEATKLFSLQGIAVQGENVTVHATALKNNLERVPHVFELNTADERLSTYTAQDTSYDQLMLTQEDREESFPLFNKDGTAQSSYNLIPLRVLTQAFPNFNEMLSTLADTYQVREIIHIVPEEKLYFSAWNDAGEALIAYSTITKTARVIKQGEQPIWSIAFQPLETA